MFISEYYLAEQNLYHKHVFATLLILGYKGEIHFKSLRGNQGNANFQVSLQNTASLHRSLRRRQLV